MSLPISVLLRELAPYAPAVQNCGSALCFSAVRDYPDGDLPPRDDILYLIPDVSRLPAPPLPSDLALSSLCFAVPAGLAEALSLREAGCGLIVFSDGADYPAICAELRALFARQDAWEKRLETESSLPGLLEACDFGAGLTVLVWDAGMSLCAAYPPILPEPGLYEIAGRLRGASLRISLESALLVQSPEIIAITSAESEAEASVFLVPVYREGKPMLFTALSSEGGPVSELARWRFCLLSKRLSACYSPDWLRPSAAVAADAVLPARFEGLLQPARSDGWRHHLCVIEFDDYFPLKARMLLDSLRRYLPDEAVFWLNGQICVLISDEVLRRNEVLPRFNALLGTHRAYCGLSKQLSTPAEFRTAYEQARTALRLGKADHHPQKSESRCYRYRDYAEMHSLAMYAQSMGSLLSLLPAKLDSFYRDSLRDESDIRLLSLFLNTGMSPSATAKELNIHRNTVINRLNRMKEDYGIDLSSADCLRDVTHMLTIAQYYRRYGTENPLKEE